MENEHGVRLQVIAPGLLLALILLLAGCGEPTTTPVPYSRDQAIARATQDAKQSMPEVGIQQARIDTITAELMTLGEADRRVGGQRGPGGYSPGQTPDSPVWWVAVRGYFRFEGMRAPPNPPPTCEAEERDFIYDERTGEEVGGPIPNIRCSPISQASATPNPSPSPTANPGITPVPQVRLSSEFTNLNDAQKLAAFTVLVPAEIPDNLQFAKGWVFDFEDRSQTVRMLFADPERSTDPNEKTVDIQLTATNATVAIDSVTHQFRELALDVREAKVRGSVGYTYWSPSAAMLNYAVLVWREGKLTIRITLFGDWPQPTGENPHGLDPLLLRIAESLKPI